MDAHAIRARFSCWTHSAYTGVNAAACPADRTLRARGEFTACIHAEATFGTCGSRGAMTFGAAFHTRAPLARGAVVAGGSGAGVYALAAHAAEIARADHAITRTDTRTTSASLARRTVHIHT